MKITLAKMVPTKNQKYNIAKILSLILFVLASYHSICRLYITVKYNVYSSDFKSDIFFESLFLISNIIGLAGCFFIFKKFSLLKIGAFLAVIIKSFHMIVEFLLSGGFYASLMENSPDFTVPVFINFLTAIIFYLIVFAGAKTMQIVYKVVLPIFFALASFYCIWIVSVNYVHRNDFQDGYADLSLNTIFLVSNILCFILSLFKYKPRMLFEISVLVVAISKLLHIMAEYIITGGLDMMVGYQSSKIVISVLIGLIILILFYIGLFIYSLKKLQIDS